MSMDPRRVEAAVGEYPDAHSLHSRRLYMERALARSDEAVGGVVPRETAEKAIRAAQDEAKRLHRQLTELLEAERELVPRETADALAEALGKIEHMARLHWRSGYADIARDALVAYRRATGGER
jgi:hypothetical protein